MGQFPLSREDEDYFTQLTKRKKVSHEAAVRAKIILFWNEGFSSREIAKRMGLNKKTVLLWKNRYLEFGRQGALDDRPRCGRPKQLSKEFERELVFRTLHEKPGNAVRWSRSRMAKIMGVSLTTVGLIWKKYGLKPHLKKKLSS
jgi:transposase